MSGTLEIEISGTEFGEFDVLTVGSAATLAGNIEIVLANGFVPAVGTTFRIITATTVTNEFDNMIWTGFPVNLGIHVIYEADSVTLEVVALSPGDCDDDGDTDLADLECFLACMLGPGQIVTPSCEVLDIDRNGSVDLLDYGYFSIVFRSN